MLQMKTFCSIVTFFISQSFHNWHLLHRRKPFCMPTTNRLVLQRVRARRIDHSGVYISMSLSFHLIRMDYELYFYVVCIHVIMPFMPFMPHIKRAARLLCSFVRSTRAIVFNGGSYVVRFALIIIKRLHFLFVSTTTRFTHLLKPSAHFYKLSE